MWYTAVGCGIDTERGNHGGAYCKGGNMTNAELISKLVDILEEVRKPCEDCQEFDCDNCKFKWERVSDNG